jgi:hypothetical protein
VSTVLKNLTYVRWAFYSCLFLRNFAKANSHSGGRGGALLKGVGSMRCQSPTGQGNSYANTSYPPTTSLTVDYNLSSPTIPVKYIKTTVDELNRAHLPP